MKNIICKSCGTDNYKLYPNKLCQVCLSQKFEKSTKLRGKEYPLDSLSLIKDYLDNLKSINQIAKEQHVKPNLIRKSMKDFGIPLRSSLSSVSKYMNEKTFEELNPESAYLLGYILTDGDLVPKGKNSKEYLRIYSKHRYLIENIKTILKAEAKIQSRPAKVYKGINQSEMSWIHIQKPKILNDLSEWGMEVDKTKLIFPKIPDSLLHHFIRGLWTGSGCVTLDGTTVISSIQFSSFEFIKSLESHLNQIGLKKRNIYKNNQTKGTSYLIKYATKDSDLLYRYLYKGNNNLTTCKRHEKIYKDKFTNSQTKLL